MPCKFGGRASPTTPHRDLFIGGGRRNDLGATDFNIDRDVPSFRRDTRRHIVRMPLLRTFTLNQSFNILS